MTVPKFRAYGRKDYRMSTEIEPKEMYHDVSVVTTFDDKKQHVITDFGMWNEEEYSGTELIDYDLMQSTGLKDKNGTDVFEGDVIDWFYWDNFEQKGRAWITYENAMFALRDVKTGEVVWDSLFDCSENCEVYVVDNIHENPDLLEGLND